MSMSVIVYIVQFCFYKDLETWTEVAVQSLYQSKGHSRKLHKIMLL